MIRLRSTRAIARPQANAWACVAWVRPRVCAAPPSGPSAACGRAAACMQLRSLADVDKSWFVVSHGVEQTHNDVDGGIAIVDASMAVSSRSGGHARALRGALRGLRDARNPNKQCALKIYVWPAASAASCGRAERAVLLNLTPRLPQLKRDCSAG